MNFDTPIKVEFLNEEILGDTAIPYFTEISKIYLGYRQCYKTDPTGNVAISTEDAFATMRKVSDYYDEYNKSHPNHQWQQPFTSMLLPSNEVVNWLKYWKMCLFIAKHMNHESPLEHGSMTVRIQCSRDCSLQWVRSRIASHCLAGYTRISTSGQKTNHITIADLYRMPAGFRQYVKVRYMDNYGELKYATPKNITYSGPKPVYRLTTAHGYSIDATAEHYFITDRGWVQLGDLIVGTDFVRLNGQPAYKNIDWLRHKYWDENLSQTEIGALCGVGKECIRKWIRLFGLQKPMGSWTIGVSPVNKGRTKEDYEPLQRVSEKLKGHGHVNRMYGPDNPQWKEDVNTLTDSGLQNRFRRNIIKLHSCQLCEATNVPTEIHHMIYDRRCCDPATNGIELCIPCHKLVHGKILTEAVVRSRVVSIQYVGVTDTYDIEMGVDEHNFVANGFVVHNSQESQRYVKTTDPEFICPPSIKSNPIAYQEFQQYLGQMQYVAETMRRVGVPNEDIRAIFPNAITTHIVTTANFREWQHILEERCCTRAQWQIRDIATQIRDHLQFHIPFIFHGSKCERLGYCPEGKGCCGKKPVKEAALNPNKAIESYFDKELKKLSDTLTDITA